MTPQLNDELKQAISAHGGCPVQVVDPQTQAIFYLISGEQFSLLRALLTDEPFEIADAYAAQDEALRKVWDDSALDVYNSDDTPPPQP